MRGRRFQGTSTPIDTAHECVNTLHDAYGKYRSARSVYAAASLEHSLAHHGFDVEAMESATVYVSETQSNYFETVKVLKEAHRKYRAAYRTLSVNKLL